MQYRPEIDGLRALAVLPVIFYHAGFGLFSGGFVGVDVFFVISGYLITGIICDEIDRGRFSLLGFYERRLRRILPALLLVCIVCIPFAWVWMLPNEFRDFGQSLLAVGLFSSNVLFWLESDYFAPGIELKPLIHTWSLAVEEQFYIVFPVLVLVIAKYKRPALLPALVALCVLSFGLMEWGWRNRPEANFYLLPFRAWELGVGSILAVAFRRNIVVFEPLGSIGALAGLLLILGSVFAFDSEFPFPSAWTLAPVLGTILLISCATGDNPIARLLSWKPLVGLGLISYSLYLWHQPLFAFARLRSLESVPGYVFMGLGALSVLLAYFSWRFVEQPCRNKHMVTRRQVISGAVTVSLALVTFGFVGHVSNGLINRFSPLVASMQTWSSDRNPREAECHGQTELIDPKDACAYNAEHPTRIAVWGDSHADVIITSLAGSLDQFGLGVEQFTFADCVPAVGYYTSNYIHNCPQFNTNTLDHLLDSASLQTIVLSGRYTLRLEGGRFDNQEGGIEPGAPAYDIPIGESRSFINKPSRIERVGKIYRSTVERLLDGGKRVVLVYPVPEAGWDVPSFLAREIYYGIKRSNPLTTSFDVFKERNRNTHAELDKLGDHPNFIRVRPEKVFCDTHVPERCLAQHDKKPLYYDQDHLSSVGSDMLTERIVEAMKNKGWLRH